MVTREDCEIIPKKYRIKIGDIARRMPNEEKQTELLHEIAEQYLICFKIIENNSQFQNDDERHRYVMGVIINNYGSLKPQFQEGDFATAKEWYLYNLEQEKCVLCDSSSNLHYHHVNPATKEHNIFEMLNKNLSKELIEKEMKKCIIVCRQCHQKIHKKDHRLSKFGVAIKKLLSKYSNLTVDTE